VLYLTIYKTDFIYIYMTDLKLPFLNRVAEYEKYHNVVILRIMKGDIESIEEIARIFNILSQTLHEYLKRSGYKKEVDKALKYAKSVRSTDVSGIDII
jgi:DNA invertase Pin-like site-specific DNA recombinase